MNSLPNTHGCGRKQQVARVGTDSVLDLKQQPNDEYRAFLIMRSFKPQSTLVPLLAAPAESESLSETQRAEFLEAERMLSKPVLAPWSSGYPGTAQWPESSTNSPLVPKSLTVTLEKLSRAI